MRAHTRRPTFLGAWRRDTVAVSDVLGSILLVAITVVLASSLSILVLSQLVASQRTHVDLGMGLSTGDGVWGNGNEAIELAHRGGEAIAEAATTVHLLVNDILSSWTGDALESAFSDGSLSIGETWVKTVTLPLGASIAVDVVVASDGGSTLIGTTTMSLSACTTDADAPYVAAWVQTPSDVGSVTSGDVEVAVTLLDACSGPDMTVAPHLYYRLNDGSDPTFNDAGEMSTTGATQFTGTIGGIDWGSELGNAIEYYVAGYEDLAGNGGSSSTQSDAVQAVVHYVSAYTAATGSVAAFSAAQSAGDGGSEAVLSEASTSSPVVLTLNANSVVTSGTGWSATSDAYASDDAYATNAHNNPGLVQYGYPDTGGTSGTITLVQLKAELSITSWANDAFTLQACVSGTCSAASSNVGQSSNDTIVTYDITNLRPSGGSWTWTDLDNLDAKIQPVKSSTRDGAWRVDWSAVEVTYSPSSFAMSIEMEFSGIPTSTTKTLELVYRAVSDTFTVQVWDGSTWNARGAGLTGATQTSWSYSLTSDEHNAGAPRIRFTDATPAGFTQANLNLDYVRVSSS